MFRVTSSGRVWTLEKWTVTSLKVTSLKGARGFILVLEYPLRWGIQFFFQYRRTSAIQLCDFIDFMIEIVMGIFNVP